MPKRKADTAELDAVNGSPNDSSPSTAAATAAAMGGSSGGASSSTPVASGGAAKERVRVSKACDICKRKKTKCDGLNPCSSCEKNGRVCLYSASSQGFMAPYNSGVLSGYEQTKLNSGGGAGGGAGGSSGSGGGRQGNGYYSADTVHKLLDRINQLEKLVGHVGASSTSTSPGMHVVNTQGIEFVNSDPVALEEAVEPEHAANQINRMRYSNRYYQILGNLFGKNVRQMLTPQHQEQASVPRVQCYGYNLSGRHYLKARPILAPKPLISREMEIFLLNYFFDHVNPMYAILHRAMFMKQYQTAMDKQDRPECRLFIAMFHAICAISMRWSEVQDGHTYPSGLEEELFEDAYSTIQAFAFEWESIEIVQGLLLITMYLRAVHRQSTCWSVLGQAIRLAYGLGLMKKSLYGNRKGYDGQKHVRIFWCCYTWDRLVGIDLGRSFFLRDEEITWDRLTRYVDDGWLTPMAYGLIRLAQCVSPLNNTNGSMGNVPRATTVAVYHDLLEWNNMMEADFGMGNDNEFATPKTNHAYNIQMLCHLRLQYHECIFYVYRLSMLGLAVSPRWEMTVSTTDRKAVLQSAKGIVNSVGELVRMLDDKTNTVWWLVLSSLYNACTVLLLFVNGGVGSHSELTPFVYKGMRLVDKFAADDRFAMAKECQWALRTLNHLVCMRLEESQEELKRAGISHGTAEINKHHFASLGVVDKGGNVLPLNEQQQAEYEANWPTQQHSHQQLTAGNQQSQSQPQPQQQQHTNVIQRPPPVMPQDFVLDSGNLESSIEWFDNWTFDDSPAAVATYFQQQPQNSYTM